MPASRRFQSISWSGDLIEELAGHHLGGLPPLGAYGGTGHIQPTLGAGDAHVGQTTFLRQFAGVLSSSASAGTCPCSRPRQEDDRIFETLGGVQRHQRDRTAVLAPHRQLVGIRHQRRGLEEPRQRGVRGLLLVFGGHGLQLGTGSRRGRHPAGHRNAAVPRAAPDLESTSATISEGLPSWATANSRNAVIRSRNARSCVAVRVGAPSSSTWSTPSKNVAACVSAYIVTNDSGPCPQPSLGHVEDAPACSRRPRG